MTGLWVHQGNIKINSCISGLTVLISVRVFVILSSFLNSVHNLHVALDVVNLESILQPLTTHVRPGVSLMALDMIYVPRHTLSVM